jgi:hypothetical protein
MVFKRFALLFVECNNPAFEGGREMSISSFTGQNSYFCSISLSQHADFYRLTAPELLPIFFICRYNL